jgi:hypothetical protein
MLPPLGHTYVKTHPHWYPGKADVVPVARRRRRKNDE